MTNRKKKRRKHSLCIMGNIESKSTQYTKRKEMMFNDFETFHVQFLYQ
ncbi:hypothetical protein Bhyg_02608, partial [Pseudolycoriella hygida]